MTKCHVFLAVFGLFLMPAGCRRSDDTASTSPATQVPATAPNTPTAEDDANAPSYHGRTLDAWKQRAAERDPTVRAEAIEALGQIAVEHPKFDILPLLVLALGDADAGVMRKAQDALQGMAPDSVAALVAGLASENGEIRMQAALALEAIGPEAEAAVAPLIGVLTDRDANVRDNAANALVQIGPASLPGLIAALQGESTDLREQAARTLRKMGPVAKQAVPALVKALEDDSVDVHTAVSSALFAIDREAAEKAGLQ